MLKWFSSQASTEWVILLSRKGLELGSTHFAEVDPETKTIIINPYKSVDDFVISLVHEVLHVLFPKSRENTILRWEKEVMSVMTPSEKTRLLTTIFQKDMVTWDE